MEDTLGETMATEAPIKTTGEEEAPIEEEAKALAEVEDLIILLLQLLSNTRVGRLHQLLSLSMHHTPLCTHLPLSMLYLHH